MFFSATQRAHHRTPLKIPPFVDKVLVAFLAYWTKRRRYFRASSTAVLIESLAASRTPQVGGDGIRTHAYDAACI